MAIVVLGEDFESFSEWTATGTATSVTGRTGLGVRLGTVTSTLTYSFVGSSESDTITVGVAWQISNFATANRSILGLKSDSAGTTHLTLMVNTAGLLEIRRGTTTGTVLGSSAAGLIAINTWYYLEVQAKLHDSTGFVTVRRNGTAVITVPTADTKNAGTKTTFDSITLSIVTSATATFDDCYVVTGTDGTFKGEPPWPVGAARLARIDSRVPTLSLTPDARLAQINSRVLTGHSAPEARLAQASLRALTVLVTEGRMARISLRALITLIPTVGGVVKVWTGAAFVDGPVKTWSGSVFADAVAVKTWDGTAFTIP